MSELLIVVNPRNADQNTLADIALAMTEIGARFVETDEASNVLTVALPSSDVPLLEAIDGVTYVRPVHHYFCPAPTAESK